MKRKKPDPAAVLRRAGPYQVRIEWVGMAEYRLTVAPVEGAAFRCGMGGTGPAGQHGEALRHILNSYGYAPRGRRR